MWSAHRLTPLLYGVPPTDALSLVAAEAALLLVGALACWIPVRRALRGTLIEVIGAP